MKSTRSNRGHDLAQRWEGTGGGGGEEGDSLRWGQRGGTETCDSVGQLSVKRGHSYGFRGWA